jgi:hypothetical protein
MRSKGSAQFEPYYKVQVWEARSVAWKDIQKAFPTAEHARASFLSGKECRIMEISMTGRRPL